MMSELLEHVFWTKPEDEENPPDPLGLDAMREDLSNKLVPVLTGRTTSVDHAFWMLTLLRWSQDISTEADIVQRFLWWERCLKLVWAHYPSIRPEESFSGIDQATRQGRENGAPRQKYQRLLANQRFQGLLGEYGRPMRSICLIRSDRLALTESGTLLTESVAEPPKLEDGNWTKWKTGFVRTQKRGIKVFRQKFQYLLKSEMPELHAALTALGWPETEAWHEAANWLGSKRDYAQFAHSFCKWADEVRSIFDSIVFDEVKTIANWPRLDVPVPSDLIGRRWNTVRYMGNLQNPNVRDLVEWHREEFKDRGRGSQIWLDCDMNAVHSFSRNASRGPQQGSDCRWKNAVLMMKPKM
jgi:hypothetical protein